MNTRRPSEPPERKQLSWTLRLKSFSIGRRYVLEGSSFGPLEVRVLRSWLRTIVELKSVDNRGVFLRLRNETRTDWNGVFNILTADGDSIGSLERVGLLAGGTLWRIKDDSGADIGAIEETEESKLQEAVGIAKGLVTLAGSFPPLSAAVWAFGKLTPPSLLFTTGGTAAAVVTKGRLSPTFEMQFDEGWLRDERVAVAAFAIAATLEMLEA